MKMHEAILVQKETEDGPEVHSPVTYGMFRQHQQHSPNGIYWLECADETCGGAVYAHRKALERGVRSPLMYTDEGFSHYPGAASETCKYSNKNDERFVNRETNKFRSQIRQEVQRIIQTPVYQKSIRKDLELFFGADANLDEHYRNILKDKDLTERGIFVPRARLITVAYVLKAKTFVRTFSSGKKHAVRFAVVEDKPLKYECTFNAKWKTAVVAKEIDMVFANSDEPVKTYRFQVWIDSDDTTQIGRDKGEPVSRKPIQQDRKPPRKTRQASINQTRFNFGS